MSTPFSRLVKAGYMELHVPAGGFSCGTCRFAAPGPNESRGLCMKFKAFVSPGFGCCNAFEPAGADPVLPQQWEMFR